MPDDKAPVMNHFIEFHSRELTLLTLVLFVLITLIVVVPQLLRAHLRKVEMLHDEHMKALEKGDALPAIDDRSRLAGRLSLLVPMVGLITAGTVTSFLGIYNSDNIFPVSLAVWVVAGVVSLAAITGGVALVTRLAHLDETFEEEEEDNFSETPFPR